jgi:hypothetical protein
MSNIIIHATLLFQYLMKTGKIGNFIIQRVSSHVKEEAGTMLRNLEFFEYLLIVTKRITALLLIPSFDFSLQHTAFRVCFP